MSSSKKGKRSPQRSRKRNTAPEKRNDNANTELRNEIIFITSAALTILLFLCNFHIIGSLGNVLSSVMFGIFGNMAYVAPVLIFFAVYFAISNFTSKQAMIKLAAGIVTFILFCIFFTLTAGVDSIGSRISDYYRFSSTGNTGGGVIGGLLGKAMYDLLGLLGSVGVMLLLFIICLVILTQRSFIGGLKRGSGFAARRLKDDYDKYIENSRRYEQERKEERYLREKRSKEISDEEDDYINEVRKREGRPYIKTRGTGIASMDDTDLRNSGNENEKPAVIKENDPLDLKSVYRKEKETNDDPVSRIRIRGVDDVTSVERILPGEIGDNDRANEDDAYESEPVVKRPARRVRTSVKEPSEEKLLDKAYKEESAAVNPAPLKPENPSFDKEVKKKAYKGPYKFPPLSLLKKGSPSSSSDAESLRETARKLTDALKTFGVNGKVTEISKGPAVTRFEVQPEVGVKVNKIVSLTDDLKLHLAAKDIRIEAPIPGKAAVGIEIPNEKADPVSFRDLLESKEYRNSKAGLTFAVGKDLSGQIIVSDIAKMPHLLIAGSTGSGKSVCINTIIMSILYKSKPEEVKLIMIDPKVVELSIYNGIPHLMLPVVTDPKKASAALQWAVNEMSRRYEEFGRANVRNIQGFNEKAEKSGEEKMPLILIIVDEMADLMMVASNEVEASVCRLAQLARAAGIHLVIATQRPSVDVITGLIKANFPSRIAFAVSSGVDSRTILDKVGAERLLGKGDMLFNPQGAPEPMRVQGAFISDDEISSVVDYIKDQGIGNDDSDEIAKQIDNMTDSSSSFSSGGSAGSDERDPLYVDAGRYIIEKEKASIGNLQRVFKIGFNRAARIMDQLEEAGVVGPEEGTKPRRVLMKMDQFDEMI